MNSAALTLALTAALAAGPPVTVKSLVGATSTKGTLTELTTSKVTLEGTGAPRTLAAAELMWVEFPAPPKPTEKPAVWIELLDGSKLLATAYTTTSGKAKIELTTRQSVEIPTRAIRHVRFREQLTPELAAQWREIVGTPATGDIVVIRKTSMRSVEQGDAEPITVTEQALDQVEGTIHDVGPDSVLFESDGEKIPVKREKLDGLVYYQPAKREFSRGVCRLIDAGGSSWSLRDVQLAADNLKAATIGGISVEIPLTAVAKVDYSIGNVAFLADLEPDTGGGDLTVSLQPAAMSYKFGHVFRARSGPPLGADAFRIGGKKYDGGMSLHSPLSLVYRVPEGFRWLRALAGVDDSVIAPGRFDLVVLGDGKELLRRSYDGKLAQRQAEPIDVDLAGVRRVTIVLDPADGQDFGDQLDLVDARFTK